MPQRIRQEKQIAHGINENGAVFSTYLCYPVFVGESVAIARLNGFYQQLMGRIAATAERFGCHAVCDMQITKETETGYSLFLDLRYYHDRELLYCRRLADVRDWDGTVKRLTRSQNRQLRGWDGWYEEGTRVYRFRHREIPADGPPIRRSEYRKCLEWEPIPELSQKKRRKEKKNTSIP